MSEAVTHAAGTAPTLREQVARYASPDWFLGLAPALTIGCQARPPAATTSQPCVNDVARHRFALDGYFNVPEVIGRSTCSLLADAVRSLTAQGAPALLVYVYDQVWDLVAPVSAALRELTGADYDAIPDVWAWHLRGGRDPSGWRPHRGTYVNPCQPNTSGLRQPPLINVWIPLVDVDERNACMWAVPLRQDTDYPDRMERLQSTAAAKPLPASEGSMVGWDSNVLHWGGAMAADPSLERIAVSFTMANRQASPISIDQRLQVLRFRLSLIGDMLRTYAEFVGARDRDTSKAIALARGMVAITGENFPLRVS